MEQRKQPGSSQEAQPPFLFLGAVILFFSFCYSVFCVREGGTEGREGGHVREA